MDNRLIKIQSEGHRALDLALELIFANAPGKGMSHFCEVAPHLNKELKDATNSLSAYQAKTLVLFWHSPEKSWKWGEVKKKALSLHQAQSFVRKWLDEQTVFDQFLGPEWFDGSLGKGFIVFNEEWGHVGDSSYAFAAIRPVHSWYGK